MITSCPICGEPVRVPPSIQEGVRVACPLCRSEYDVADALASLPPMLKRVEPPATAEPESALDRSDLSPPTNEFQDFSELEIELEESAPTASTGTEPPSAPTFDFDAQTTLGGSATPVPTGSAAKYRPKARRRNAVSEFAKIVLGGIAGLVIAQAFLWWLPPGWRRDPLGLAPRLPPSLAFLAPKSFRVPTGPTVRPSSGDASPETKPRKNPGFDLKSALETAEANSTAESPFSDNSPDVPVRDLGNRGDGALPETPSATPEARDDNVETEPMTTPDPSRESVGDGGATTREPPDLSVDALLGVRDAPTFLSRDLNEALVSVMAAHDDWTSAKAADPSGAYKQSVRRLFESFYELAWTVTFADDTDPQVVSQRDQIDRVLLETANSPENAELVGRAAASWLHLKNRPTEGILLAGVVRSVAPVGLYYVTTLELLGTQRTVSAVSQLPPAGARRHPYQVGDRLLMLGAIMSEPSVDIIGFEGDNAPVVWSGQWVALPPAANR